MSSPPRLDLRRVSLALAPLIVFLGLAGLLYFRLGAGDAARIPSALIGQAAPSLDLPGLGGKAGLTDSDLRQGHGHARSTSSHPGACLATPSTNTCWRSLTIPP